MRASPPVLGSDMCRGSRNDDGNLDSHQNETEQLPPQILWGYKTDAVSIFSLWPWHIEILPWNKDNIFNLTISSFENEKLQSIYWHLEGLHEIML